jgi:hypothetical protein
MKTISKLLILFFFILGLTNTFAQNFPSLDASPADIVSFRGKDKQMLIKIVYGRPQKKGRVIFGELEPYGKVWRTGANEATEIKFYQDVSLDGKSIKAGTYTLFTIPEKDKWTIILNSELDQWGAYMYKKEKDVLRLDIKTNKPENVVEAFSILINETDNGANMIMAWDDVRIDIPIKFSKSTKKK